MSKVTVFFILSLILFSCSNSIEPLFVQIDKAIPGVIPPLPQGFNYSTDAQDRPVLKITLQKSTGARNTKPYLIGCEPLIPLRKTDKIPSDITLNFIDTEKIDLIPFSKWLFPGKGATVDGKTINDSLYPLWSSRNLELTWAENISLENKISLLKWVNSFPQAAVPAFPVTWIAGAGDMMLQRGVQDILLSGNPGPGRIFNDILPHLSSFDLLMANLEGAVTSGGGVISKSYNFRFSPRILPVLKKIGFDYFSLTNNHAYDYGPIGFKDTLENFIKAQLPTSGVGLTIQEALQPTNFSINGTNIRVLSIGAYPQEQNGFNGQKQASVTDQRPGILWFNQSVLDTVKSYANAPGIDIIMIHGGHEWQRSTSSVQRRQYRSLIDSGVEIVFGSHPHVLQGVETYNGGIIYYSLGNFVFNGMQDMPHAQDSLIAVLGIVGEKIIYRKDIGVIINEKVLQQDLSGRILTELADLSRAIPPG